MNKSEKLLLLLLLVLAVSFGLAYHRLSREIGAVKAEMVSEYLRQEGFYFNGDLHPAETLQIFEGRPFISYHFVKEFMAEDMTLSASGQRVYIPIDKVHLDFEDQTLNAYLKENLVDINLPLYQGEYLPLDTLAKVLFFEYGEVDHHWYLLTEEKVMTGRARGSLYINHNLNIEGARLEGDVEVLGVLAGEGVFVVSDHLVGFVREKDFEESSGDGRYFSRYSFREQEPLDDPFYLVWDQINSYEEAVSFDPVLVEKSADVISPTLFALNINGIIINSADLTYSRWAHEEEKRVWALVSNAFNPDWTREMLEEEALKSRFIAQLVLLGLIYEYDGINLDFENIYLADQELLNDFVREASEVMALTGLPLSMDFTVPEGSDQWSKVYDRQTLAGYLDYFILMAYDEFWASSDISGPVASLPWTLEGVLKTLELVPTEKLILGIPGYMRVWEDTGGGNTSNVLSIKNRDSYLEERNFEITYLEDLSMNYASRREGNTLYRIWLEDETAIGRRLEIVKDFNLPGIALWRRNFIDEQTEQFIEENLD